MLDLFCIALCYGFYVNCLLNLDLSILQKNRVRASQQRTIMHIDACHWLEGLELSFASLKVLCGLNVFDGLDILGTFAKCLSQGA